MSTHSGSGSGSLWSLGPRSAAMTASAAQGLATGMLVGAMLGAAQAAAHETTSGGERVASVASEALREATRLGIASGAGALVASLLPGGALVRGIAWIATGAVILSAGQTRDKKD